MKDTTKILEELQLCDDFKSFYDENKEYWISDNLSELLNQFVEKYQLKKTQIIKESEISEVYAYQIFSGKRKPERKKLLCLSIAMGLSLDDVQALMKCAKYSVLYVKNPFDCVIIYGICNGLTVAETNKMLYTYDLETLW